jgi:hypothetical protein
MLCVQVEAVAVEHLEFAGLYAMLPLGQRVLSRIEQVLVQEAERDGALPVSLPMLQPAELWRRTGRFERYGPEMFALRNRRGQDVVLAPTHEEAITVLAAELAVSYKQLPVLVYQVARKFRDELRPRQGLLRTGGELTGKAGLLAERLARRPVRSGALGRKPAASVGDLTGARPAVARLACSGLRFVLSAAFHVPNVAGVAAAGPALGTGPAPQRPFSR